MAVVEANISMSVDGYVTGPNVDQHPGLGAGGEVLHAWIGDPRGPEGQRVLEPMMASWGAVITSRRVYEVTGGWGEDGFYRMPVFVLTHRRQDVLVKGATTFTFVTDGIEAAVAQAVAAAGDKRVHIMGGASVIQQALNAGLVDELHLHVAPVLLGAGTALFDNLDRRLDLEPIAAVQSRSASHQEFRVLKADGGAGRGVQR